MVKLTASIARTVINGGPDFQIELKFRSVGFSGRKNPENLEKNVRSKARTNNKLNPHDTAGEYGNRTRVTVRGGSERLSTEPPVLPCFVVVKNDEIQRCEAFAVYSNGKHQANKTKYSLEPFIAVTFVKRYY